MDPNLAASLSKFAFRFCNEQPNDKTLICSPLSAEVVLAQTALASTGDTHAELLRTMDLPDDEAVRSLFGFLTSTLKSIEGVTLRIANRVFVTNKSSLRPSIKKDAEEVFDSGLEQLDFTQCNAAADIMNKWVAEQTDNMIQKVVSPFSLNEDTGLVLVNAIYFQGLWANPFRKMATREWSFHVNNTTEIKVAMMRKSNENFRYRYSPELKAKILQMFYTGGKASMVLVLPDEIEGLDEMLQQLANGHDLMAEIADLQSKELCNIVIPKFKVETDINLNELLPKMGITQIFDEFKSGIWMLSNQEKLFVSQAVQKAVIEVNEVGTKAAVRTCVGQEFRLCRNNDPKLESFIANHPFLYLLMAQDIPLFLGTFRCGKFATPITRKPKTYVSSDNRPGSSLEPTDCNRCQRPKISKPNYSFIEPSNERPTPVTTGYNGYENEIGNEVVSNQLIDPTINLSNEIPQPITPGVEDQTAQEVFPDHLR